MENNTPKKLTKAAAIVSLAAALAATPVGALAGTSASPYYAHAYCFGYFHSNVYVEVSCMYGGDSASDRAVDDDDTASATIDLTDARMGEARYSYAGAYTGESLIGYKEWVG